MLPPLGAVPPNEPNNKQNKTGEKRLSVSFSTLATFVFLGFAALVLAYVAGVMSGRHGFNTAKAPAIRSTSKAPEQTKGDILLPEQLEFVKALRESKAESDPEIKTKIKQENKEQRVEKAENINQTDKIAQQGASANIAKNNNDTEPDTNQTNQNASRTDIYDYLFQVGAFRDESGADALRQKFEGLGYRTTLEKSGKMYIVLIKLRGDSKRATEIEESARSLRLGTPLLRKRTLVN